MTTRSDADLLHAYRDGNDASARDELIERHLPLVRALARRYAYRGESLDDLVQVGSIGLINAIDRFDFARGSSLETYAIPYVIGEIKRHFRDRGWAVRPPRGLQELSIRLNDVVDRLSVRLGRSPTLTEIAASVGVDEEQVLEALECGALYHAQSLSTPIGDANSAADLLSMIGTRDEGYATIDDRAVIAEGMRALDERERTIVYLRFYGGLTQSQIASRIGISQMHVSRLLRAAVRRMHERIVGPDAAEPHGREGT